ncbi:MAG: FecR family protein [Bacteroidales bacterium]
MDKEILYRFFKHKSSRQEEKQILDWLDEDGENIKKLEKERTLFDVLLLSNTENDTPKTNIHKLKWRSYLSYAAIALLFIFLGSQISVFNNKDNENLYSEIIVPKGQRVNLVLPDGTNVWLNSMAKLRYPNKFIGDERNVKLEGEGYFDVTHDEKHQFVVHTTECDVRVKGTIFDVHSASSKSPFFVSLVEGSIVLHDNSNQLSDVLIKPNQTVFYNSKSFKTVDTPDSEDFLWKEGILSFKNKDFKDLLNNLGEIYGVTFDIKMNDIPTEVLSGKIRIDEGLDHALWVMQRNSTFTYTRDISDDSIIHIIKEKK